MLILDTDHVSQLSRVSRITQSLKARLDVARQPLAITATTLEEAFRGRLAQVVWAKSKAALISSYARLQEAVEDFRRWRILQFDTAAADIYDRLRTARLGVSTMDLRIASIAIANNATLLSRNLRDFEPVPDLKVEDWLS